MTLQDKIERRLWSMILAGGGNGATIRAEAKAIARICQNHKEPKSNA